MKSILILILASISISHACRCLPRTEREKYCASDFAGTITVTSAATACGSNDLCYGIIIHEQIRGAATTATVLQTMPSSEVCGVTLTPGQVYFIAGSVSDSNALHLIHCQLYQNWTNLAFGTVISKIKAFRNSLCYSPIKLIFEIGPAAPRVSD